jgi:hypothetical protein
MLKLCYVPSVFGFGENFDYALAADYKLDFENEISLDKLNSG